MGTLFTDGQSLTAAMLNQRYAYSDTTTTQVMGTGPSNLSNVYTIPAGEPIAGSAYELVCGGTGTWGSPAQACGFSLYLQGIVICSNVTIAAAAFSAGAGFRWEVTAGLTCASAGPSGSFIGGLEASITQAANPVLPGTAADNTVTVADANTGTTIDTTDRLFAKVSAGFASNTGSPTITCRRTSFAKVA